MTMGLRDGRQPKRLKASAKGRNARDRPSADYPLRLEISARSMQLKDRLR